MKKFLNYFAVALLAGLIGYGIDHEESIKHREAADAWSDLCRIAYDHMVLDGEFTQADIEDLFGDYADDMPIMGYHITKRDLEQYSWCY